MGLRLGGARTDRGPADQVGDVLRRDGVEQLRSGGKPEVEHVAQEGARDPQARRDIVRAVEVRVHDEALPAHRGPRLLKIDPHDDHHPVRHLARERGQAPPVFEARIHVMDRAGTHDEEHPVVVRENEAMDVPAGLRDETRLHLGLGNLGQERRRRGEGPGLDDIDVGGALHGFG